MLSADFYDKTDGGTIVNGNGAVKRFTGTMPVLKTAPAPAPAFQPIDIEPMVTCVPGWTGPDCKTPIEPLPTTQGGTPVVTQPVSDIPATPDSIPWWKQIATAIIPGDSSYGAFGPESGGLGPSMPPTVSAAGAGAPMEAGMGFGDIPPALRNIMLAGFGLFLLSQLSKGR